MTCGAISAPPKESNVRSHSTPNAHMRETFPRPCIAPPNRDPSTPCSIPARNNRCRAQSMPCVFSHVLHAKRTCSAGYSVHEAVRSADVIPERHLLRELVLCPILGSTHKKLAMWSYLRSEGYMIFKLLAANSRLYRNRSSRGPRYSADCMTTYCDLDSHTEGFVIKTQWSLKSKSKR